MKWTTERPTKPGWYWWRRIVPGWDAYKRPRCINVAPGPEGVYLQQWSIAEGAEWAGPIPEPEEVDA